MRCAFVGRPWAATATALLALGVAGSAARAQSLLDRSPNVTGDWTGAPGVLYFNFLHRFTASDPPERKVSNVPTFTLAAGLPRRLLLGLNYATNSQLAPRYPNEYEFFGRWMPLAQDAGWPLDVGGQVGYNIAAEGVDGEVSLARRLGRLRATGVARILSDPLESGKTRFAVGGGGVLRLGRYLALAGDAARLTDPREGEKTAWSAGIHLAIPLTPHTLSIQAANTNAATLQGSSVGGEDVRYGFEFTIPVTLRRYFGGRTPPTTAHPTPMVQPMPDSVPMSAPTGQLFNAGMKGFVFAPARIEIAVGTTVEWKNDDQVEHTVTSATGAFSSPLIPPGGTWRQTFTTAGEYPFYCTPHPFMRGVVVVR